MVELQEIEGVADQRAEVLRAAGFNTVEDIHAGEKAELQEIEGIGDATADAIKTEAGKLIEANNRPAEDITREPEKQVDQPVDLVIDDGMTDVGGPIGLETHKNILESVNEARSPEQLADAMEIEPERARTLLEHRTQYPLGVQHIDDITGPNLIDEDILDQILPLFGPAAIGKWEKSTNLTTPQGKHFEPVHAALLHTGDVLFFKHTHSTHPKHTGPKHDMRPKHTHNWTQIWDPNKKGGSSLSPPNNQPAVDLYCSGHSFLSNGELLVVGGGGVSTGNEPMHGWKFDPDASGGTDQWTETKGGTNAGRVEEPRWYPTLVTVGPNRVLVVDGGPDKHSIYDQSADDFTEVTSPPGATGNPAQQNFPAKYPGLHYTPSGRVICTTTGWRGGPNPPRYFEFTSKKEGRWRSFPQPTEVPRTKGMSVQILKQDSSGGWKSEILVVGGASGAAARSAETLQPDASPPSWRKHSGLSFSEPRTNVNATVLADGTVFVCGGTNSKGSTSYIYDPWAAANPWSNVAPLPSVRNYHSFALLLPSAKVLVGSADTNSIDVYRPPYLYNGTSLASRPSFQSVPNRVHHGQSFTVTMSSTSSIQKLNLVRPMAVTHQTDSEQRAVPLRFTQSGQTLTATAPNGNHPHPVAPKGYYMLFAIDSNGVPVRRGKFIHLH